jgi:hypothetical protein
VRKRRRRGDGQTGNNGEDRRECDRRDYPSRQRPTELVGQQRSRRVGSTGRGVDCFFADKRGRAVAQDQREQVEQADQPIAQTTDLRASFAVGTV